MAVNSLGRARASSSHSPLSHPPGGRSSAPDQTAGSAGAEQKEGAVVSGKLVFPGPCITFTTMHYGNASWKALVLLL